MNNDRRVSQEFARICMVMVLVIPVIQGCPTILHFFHKFVSDDWKSQYIHGWVALSSPWMGGSNLLQSYLGGWTLGFPTWLIPHDYVRPVQVNASSALAEIHQLLF